MYDRDWLANTNLAICTDKARRWGGGRRRRRYTPFSTGAAQFRVAGEPGLRVSRGQQDCRIISGYHLYKLPALDLEQEFWSGL